MTAMNETMTEQQKAEQARKQEEQAKVFEWWYTTILKANPLFLEKQGDSYKEESVALMYMGFCSGWDAVNAKESLEFKKSIMH